MDRVMEIGQREAEETMRALARVEGIFAGAQDLQKSCLGPMHCTLHRKGRSSTRSTAIAYGPGTLPVVALRRVSITWR